MIKVFHSCADTESLKAFIIKEYGLPLEEFSLYRDIGGAIYFTKTTTQKYVFKMYKLQYTDKAIKSVKITDFLKQKRFSVVSIIPAGNGELSINVDMPEGNRVGVLYEFIEGSSVTCDDIYDVGKLTGQLHNILSTYKGELPLFTKYHFIDRLIELLHEQDYDNRKIRELADYGNDLWDKVKHLPIGTVHGDLDVGNILKQPSGMLKLIDCDNVEHAPIAYDIASICNRTDFFSLRDKDIEETIKTIDQFCKSYRKERDFGDIDVNNVLDFIAVRRFEMHAGALQYLMPVEGNQRFLSFMNATYKWLMDWKSIMPS